MGSKKSAPAPAPDPAIGQAATASAQLGKEWLDFAKEQHAAGNIRQDAYDALINKVVTSDLATQEEAKQWATADRAAGQAANTKFNQYADRADALGRQYGGWLEDVANDYGQRANEQFDFGAGQRGRYSSTFAPIEDRIAKDAMEWDSDARMATEAGKARADVLAEAQRQRDASGRSMAAMGVSPNSGRFAGISRAADTATALGAAGASNMARDNVRAQGIQLRGQAAQVGQQVLGSGQAATSLGMQARGAQQGATQAAYGTKSSGLSQGQQAITAGLAGLGIGNTSANTSLNAGSSAVSAGAAGNAAFGANNAIMGQGFSGAMSGYGQQGQILGNQYGQQLNAWGAQQNANATNSAGWGSALGTIAGTGIKLLSSKEAKTDKRKVSGALEALKAMPVDAWRYKDGMGDGGEHIGPYAEDFQAATGRGDGKTIPVVDAIGVTMKAVQELSHKVDAMAHHGGAR